MAEWIYGNRYLNLEEMQHNADIFRSIMLSYGFSIEAICGMAGNVQQESTFNPGLLYGDLDTGAYGLFQWHPPSKYIEWAGSGWANNGDKQCERLNYEFENGIQYSPAPGYPMTAAEFKVSKASPIELCVTFLHNYERPGDYPAEEAKRIPMTEYWTEYYTGHPPIPIEPEKTSFKWWMYLTPWCG